MLVLTRKVNQRIQIGENVVITILHVRGQSVRVGIEAPRQVRVIRSEIADQVADETQPAPTHVGKRKSHRRSERRLTTTDTFSSPLADRVTAVVETSAFRPTVSRQKELPESYHFQLAPTSALTTHPSGQRP